MQREPLRKEALAVGDRTSVFCPIFKIDEEKGEVWGYMAEEAPDRQREILDYAKAKPQIQKWSDSQKEASGGKSLGNVRGMHGKNAAGVVTHVEFLDGEKRVHIGTKIVDPLELQKAKTGVYTGFSLGGSYAEKWKDGDLTRYVPEVQEVSLVDRPAMPGATFTAIKADGTSEERPLVGRQPKQVWACGAEEGCEHETKAEATKCDGSPIVEKREFSQKQRDKAAESGAALPDGSYPIENKSDLKNAIQAFGRAKDKAKVKAHIKSRAKALGATDMLPDDWKKAAPSESLKKCLYQVSQLAMAIESVEWVHDFEEAETAREGDNSEVPDKLKAGISALYDALVTMATEEAGEWEDEEGEEMAMAVASVLEKITAKPGRLRELLAKRADEQEDTMKPEEFQKIVGDSQAELKKAFTESIGELGKTMATNEEASKKRFEKIEADLKLVKDNTPKLEDRIAKRETVAKTDDTRDTDTKPPEKAEKDMTALELTKRALRPENVRILQ